MKVNIHYNNKTGTIEWSENLEDIAVDFPDEDIVEEVKEFLNTARTFRIPQSDTVDDFKEVSARPREGLDFMDLGLSELFAETGIRVEWPEEEPE